MSADPSFSAPSPTPAEGSPASHSAPSGFYDRLLWDYGTRERNLIGMSVFRIVAGLAILLQFLINYAQRHYLFGPEGVYPWDVFEKGVAGSQLFSIYSLSSSPIYFEVCFHLGILVATLWVLGWRTRWLTPLTFIFWWSLEHRFPGIWDGGDNILRIVLIFATFADLGAHFSLDARRREKLPPAALTEPRAAALFHNAALLAIAIQLCLLYGIAGLSKVQGETWRDGTALYYALRGGQYTWPGFSELVYQNVYLVVLFSYITVAFQIAFTFFFFMNRITRRLVLFMSIMFHLGIMSFMGLVTFSSFMMSVDLALLSDDEYLGAARWWKATWGRIRRRWGAPERAASSIEQLSGTATKSSADLTP
ncbi:MAG: HTTM domain-containing protein [Kofleriaceae bacterium]